MIICGSGVGYDMAGEEEKSMMQERKILNNDITMSIKV
jgi:hypothetical protein